MATSSSSSTTTSTTTSTTPKTKPASTALQKAGLIVELSGAASLLAGAALAVAQHHYPLAALFIGGAVAVIVGHRLHRS